MSASLYIDEICFIVVKLPGPMPMKSAYYLARTIMMYNLESSQQIDQ